jgi:DNA-binding MarR family transcriptional regulator
MATERTPSPADHRDGFAPSAPMLANSAFLLFRLGARATRSLGDALAPFDLRPRHYAVFNLLDAHTGIAQAALATRLGMDVNSVVKTLDELEGQGYVERRRDPADRRRHSVVLTPRGQAALRDVRAAADAVEAALLGALGDDERRQLHALLRKVEAGGPG